jgi:hypothetical protein
MCFVLAAWLVGCGSSGGGNATPGMDAAGGAAGSSPDAAGPTVVTYEQVKAAVFSKKCVPCHLPGGIGAGSHTLADSYATANEPSASCSGKKKGECTLVLVKSGFMPFGKSCTGDPSKDGGNPACLTAEEQKLLADWIAGGLQEK